MASYHVTPASNIEDIMSEGLSPRIGRRSEAFGEPEALVYLFKDKEALQAGLDSWMQDAFDEDEELALLVVEDLPFLEENETGFEVISRKTIPTSAIRILSMDIMSEVEIPIDASGPDF